MSLYTKNNHDTQYLPNKCYLLLPFQLKPERQAKRKKEGRNAKQRATFVNPKWNQSWIFMEGLMLKLQYFGHLMQRTDSLGKTLMLGKTEGSRKRRERQRMRWLDGITDSMSMSLSNFRRRWRTRKLGVLQFMGPQRLGHDEASSSKMEKLYTVSKNKTESWLWLRSLTPYCEIQT